MTSLRPPAGHRVGVLVPALPALFLVALVVVFSVFGHGFLRLFTVQSLLTDIDFVVLLALGQTFVIISGGIDLSVGFVMGMGSVVAALVLRSAGASVPLAAAVVLAVVAALAAGAVPGLLNGVLVATGLPPFIVTLGTYGIASGAGYLLAGGLPVALTDRAVGALGNNYVVYLLSGRAPGFWAPPAGATPGELRAGVELLPIQLLVTAVVVLTCAWCLARTRLGAQVYAVGGSRAAALRSGVPVRRRLVQVYVLSSLLASFAGVLFVFRYTSGAADAGSPLLIDAIAAVAIGGASLYGGEGSVAGTVLGALVISVVQTGLVILGVVPFWQYIAVGVIIVLAVLTDQVRRAAAAGR
jgi:ribose transport system permease protein